MESAGLCTRPLPWPGRAVSLAGSGPGEEIGLTVGAFAGHDLRQQFPKAGSVRGTRVRSDAHQICLVSEGRDPAEAMREAAPLFARHPHARDAPSVPRPMLEAAALGASEDPAAAAEAALSGQGRPGRTMRPCDEDFPLEIRDVLAAEAANTPAVARTAAATPAARPVPRPAARGPQP